VALELTCKREGGDVHAKAGRNTRTKVEVGVCHCQIVGQEDAGRTAERGSRLCRDLATAWLLQLLGKQFKPYKKPVLSLRFARAVDVSTGRVTSCMCCQRGCRRRHVVCVLSMGAGGRVEREEST